MKIQNLALILGLALFSIACSKKESEPLKNSNPHIRSIILEEKNGAYVELVANSQLAPENVIYFWDSSKETLDIGKIKKDKYKNPSYLIEVTTQCESLKKNYKFQDRFSIQSNQINLNDILPKRIYLTKETEFKCTSEINLNAVGTSNYYILKDKLISILPVKANWSDISAETHDVESFKNKTFRTPSGINNIFLECENFAVKKEASVSGEIDVFGLLNSQSIQPRKDFHAQEYNLEDPRFSLAKQNCIIFFENQFGFLDQSEVFEVIFRPLEPLITQTEIGFTTDGYTYLNRLNIFNPYEFPIFMAIDRRKMIVHTGPYVLDIVVGIEGAHYVQGEIKEKSTWNADNQVQLVELLPGQTLDVRVYLSRDYPYTVMSQEQATPFFSISTPHVEEALKVKTLNDLVARKIPVKFL